jgi:hypothetical protein
MSRKSGVSDFTRCRKTDFSKSRFPKMQFFGIYKIMMLGFANFRICQFSDFIKHLFFGFAHIMICGFLPVVEKQMSRKS